MLWFTRRCIDQIVLHGTKLTRQRSFAANQPSIHPSIPRSIVLIINWNTNNIRPRDSLPVETPHWIQTCHGLSVQTVGLLSKWNRLVISIVTFVVIIPISPNSPSYQVERPIPCRDRLPFGQRVTKNKKLYGGPRNPWGPPSKNHVSNADTPKWAIIRCSWGRSMKGKRCFTSVRIASTRGVSTTSFNSISRIQSLYVPLCILPTILTVGW